MNLTHWLGEAIAAIRRWEASWGGYAPHPALALDEDRLGAVLEDYAERLGGNYPFFHPHYAGQMLKPPHPAAVVGYLAAQLINPNNHALDGGPPTAAMEKDVVRALAAMFGLPAGGLGHLTSSGTIANLEALWIARELHPGRRVVFSEEAHYTHARMGQVLGLDTAALPADAAGRLDLDALEDALAAGGIGTVVLTAGTTGLGAVDPVEDALALCHRHGARVHVDAAYGGFFALLAGPEGGPLGPEARRHFRAIAGADSVVIDPHKHGLQPYGCGCVLFRDASAGRFYRHDSPYTYFTSGDLHLGEISLECSRAGAAAGALWFTLQLFPLEAGEGMGPVLAACRRAALRWHASMEESEHVAPLVAPELDLVTYFPRRARTVSEVDAAAQRLFERAMHSEAAPFFLSVLRTSAARLRAAAPHLAADAAQARVLRSVLMKPEHEHAVEALHARVEALAAENQPAPRA